MNPLLQKQSKLPIIDTKPIIDSLNRVKPQIVSPDNTFWKTVNILEEALAKYRVKFLDLEETTNHPEWKKFGLVKAVYIFDSDTIGIYVNYRFSKGTYFNEQFQSM